MRELVNASCDAAWQSAQRQERCPLAFELVAGPHKGATFSTFVAPYVRVSASLSEVPFLLWFHELVRLESR